MEQTVLSDTGTPAEFAAGGRVRGKIALVTGAARGLGKAIAERLIREGANVFVSDVDAAVARTASEMGASDHFIHDVTQEQDWAFVLNAIVEHAGRLDILINNAGIAMGSSSAAIDEVSVMDWNRVVEINGLGTMLGCRQALAVMSQTGGAIVNVSSVAARTPSPTIAAYGFSKAGISHLTRSVAQAGASLNIRCNAVLPGMISTKMIEGLHAYHMQLAKSGAEDMQEALGKAIPMGCLQGPQDIAAGVLFLASDEARFVTGAELVIDGGMTL